MAGWKTGVSLPSPSQPRVLLGDCSLNIGVSKQSGAVHRLFKRIPRLLYGIRAIPAAVEASTASNAQTPTPDWSRPGWFNLNTYEPEKQFKYDKEALVLHEAVPGHIFQGSIALEMTDLPDFRQSGNLSAYSEGGASMPSHWARS